ncbi:MAG: HlyD family efflux transporter periplasmic adaptor subunit [Pseudomonadota bacterium]
MTEDTTALPRSVSRPLILATMARFGALALLAIWATTAPLATTIRASGTLVSAHPAYDIQHAHGGRIGRVHVTLQETVRAGDTLFELDVETQRLSLAHLRQQITRLETENAVIRDLLNLGDAGPTLPADDPGARAVKMRYADLRGQLALDIAAAEQAQHAAQVRTQALEAGIESLGARVAAMEATARQRDRLVKRGIMTKSDAETREDLRLSVAAQIAAQEADLAAARDQADQARIRAERLRSQYRLTLLDRLTANDSRLPDLRRQAVELGAEITSAVISAPISGTVVALDYDTDRMYVPRGTTLVTLSQTLEAPAVRVIVPTNAIDQVRLGMEGQLTIPSLPQRNLPQISIKLTAISPDAQKDRDGNALGYAARATIAPEDLAALDAALGGELHLATDMPVSVALAGRTVTFAEYLVAPFFRIFEGAIQD